MALRLGGNNNEVRGVQCSGPVLYAPYPPSGGVLCAVRALCEKLAVLHHRELGKFRRLKGRH